eukprot:37228-Amphidinium_carterae.1
MHSTPPGDLTAMDHCPGPVPKMAATCAVQRVPIHSESMCFVWHVSPILKAVNASQFTSGREQLQYRSLVFHS